MKTQISSLELFYLLKEIDIAKSKVQQIYEIEKKDYIIQLHKTGIGKLLLRITPPSFFYQTKYKPEVQSPKGFIMGLRKHLKNSFFQSIQQIGFERIIELQFDTKEGKKYLYIELFGKGNVILTDENLNIINVAEQQRWADRFIKPGVEYTYPKREHNLLELSKHELKEVINSEENIGKILATEFGLGKTYSDEVLKVAGIDKTIKELTDKDITELNNALQDLKSRELKPQIIYIDDMIKDIVPIDIIAYNDMKKDKIESYNQAFDLVLTKEQKEVIEKVSSSKYEKQLGKVQKIIDMQSLQIEKLAATAKESQQIGESIYNNYQLIDEIFKELKKAKEKISWKEIKTKLKDHKIIKDVNNGRITIDI